MAENTSGLGSALSQVRLSHIVAIIVIIVSLFGINYIKTHTFSSIDRTKYLVVAEDFLYKNPTIAQKLGKVTKVSLLGAGGSAGKLSYNSFSLRGEEKSGFCQVTLEKDAEGKWDVKSATLSVAGGEYDIPVSRREEKRSMKIFGK